MTGNEDLQNEGSAEKTAAKVEREAKGAADQVEGKVRETVEGLSGDEQTEAEGELKQKKGDLERAG